MTTLPEVPSIWVHYKGNEYEVYDLLNTDADPGREVDHPVIVCYRGKNGRKWGKTLEVFLNTMKPKPVSKWAERRDRIKGLAAEHAAQQPTPEPESKKARLFDSILSNSPEVFEQMADYSNQLELLQPNFQLFDATDPKQLGALVHVQLKDTPLIQPEVDTDTKLQFVRELWNATKGQQHRTSTMMPVLNDWHYRLTLDGLASEQRHKIQEAGATYIGLCTPHQPMITTWSTSVGGDLYELVLFMSILRHVCKKFQGDTYAAQTLYQFKEEFNALVNEQITQRDFHPKDAPSAVMDGGRLRLVLPGSILGYEDRKVHYAETTFELDKPGPFGRYIFSVIFPEQIHNLIAAIFSEDALVLK